MDNRALDLDETHNSPTQVEYNIEATFSLFSFHGRHVMAAKKRKVQPPAAEAGEEIREIVARGSGGD